MALHLKLIDMQEDYKVIADREIRRRKILALMDQDVYISRYDLPGATKTKRFGLIEKDKSKAILEELGKSDKPVDEFEMNSPVYAHAENNSDKKLVINSKKTMEVVAQTNMNFSLIAVFSNRFLWLEDLQNTPFLEDQLQLITDINAVIEGERKSLEVANFDWPGHDNRQSNNSLKAAMTSVGGFLEKLNPQSHWDKSFLLGESNIARFNSSGNLGSLLTLSISSREMLLKPESKRILWSELVAYVKG